ncbi:hypothetical protein DRO03_12050 [Methanosarcinales archaeon]|nr:MAG: hypothetical protein DRO03_12050 [Methanosarcinales archaeon]
MIPLDITNEEVLRRTLEEIEDSIPILEGSTLTVTALPDGATIEEATLKINQLIGSLDQIIKAFDRN